MMLNKKPTYYAPILAVALSLIFLLSCTRTEHSFIKTVVSEKEVLKRIRAFEKNIGKQDICNDVLLSCELINDFYGTKYERECSNTTESTLSQLVKDIQDLRDLHAKVEFKYQLDTETSPVITSCKGSQICTDIIGSQLLPLNNAFGKVYAYSKSENINKKFAIFEVIELNSKMIDQQSFEYQNLHTHQLANRSFFLPEDLLSRRSLNSGQKTDQTFTVRKIGSEDRITIDTSYDAIQTRGFNEESSILRKLRLAKPSSCDEVYNSNKIVLCLEKDKAIYISIENWFISDNEFAEVFSKVKNLSDNLPLFIDVRSNRGGSPKQVLNFMCYIDLKSTMEIVQKIHYSATQPKIQYSNSENTFFETLGLVNKDLAFVRDTDERSFLEIPLLSRFNPNCSMPDLLLNRPVKVLTEGNEFSANELFLLIAKKIPQVTVVGKHSIGGSGSPITITLPNTKAELTLSIARLNDDSGELIERVGIEPDIVFQYSEEAAAFEQRVIDFFSKNVSVCAECFETTFYDLL